MKSKIHEYQNAILTMSKTLSFIFLAILLLLRCSNNDEPPKAPVDQLPPATQVGANKAGCLVNGEVFLPLQSNIFGIPSVTCSYQFIGNSFEFALGIRNDKLDNVRGITILSNKLEFIQGQTYSLNLEQNVNSSFAYYKIGFLNYSTNSIKQGQLKITKLDQVNAIISGTFWFDAVNNSGEIIKITEGRFDMKYSQ